MIFLRPFDLRIRARQMVCHARTIKQAMETVDHQINALSEDVFEGESAAYLRSEYRKIKVNLLFSFSVISYFAQSLLKIAEDFEKADRKNIFGEVLLAGGLFGGVFAGIIRKLKPGWGFERPVWWSDVCEGNAEPELNEQSNDVEPETNVGKYGDLSKYDGRSPTKGTVARPWSDIVAPLTNPSDERDSRIYNAVLNQFGVESNSRYKANQQGKNETYCNIYVWGCDQSHGSGNPPLGGQKWQSCTSVHRSGIECKWCCELVGNKRQ